MKKKIYFHINHYDDDSVFYNQVLNQLLSEGWRLVPQRNKAEKIGNSIFHYTYLEREFKFKNKAP